MSRKKPVVFIVGLVNFNWSLDWNAKTVSKYLDKDKFEVVTMSTYRNQTGTEGLQEVTLIKRKYPDKIWQFWAHFRALLKADIAIIYRHDEYKRYQWLYKLFRCPVVTILGINPNLENKRFGLTYWNSFKSIYALSPENKAFCKEAGLPMSDTILSNPIDLTKFWEVRKIRSTLKQVAFVGNDFERKHLSEYLDMATTFTHLTFHVVGGYEKELETLKEQLTGYPDLNNVRVHGMIDREALIAILNDCELHILPSRKEGRPKTAIESAAAGLPSILFYGYGAEEYIKHNENGFIVNDKQEMQACVQALLDDPSLLNKLSENTSAMAEAFDIRSRITEYEDELQRLLSSLG